MVYGEIFAQSLESVHYVDKECWSDLYASLYGLIGKRVFSLSVTEKNPGGIFKARYFIRLLNLCTNP